MVRGQSAIEYLIIVGFGLSVLAVLIVVYYEYDSSGKREIAATQIDHLGKKLVDSAEEVYYLGPPTRTTIKAYMPESVVLVSVAGNELNFVLRSGSGFTDMDFVSGVTITGALSASQGIKYIQVIAQDGRVCIVERGQPECT